MNAALFLYRVGIAMFVVALMVVFALCVADFMVVGNDPNCDDDEQ